MNVNDKNLLKLIALKIDDKVTLWNFLQVSKLTSEIVQQIKPIKDEEFNHIEFRINDTNEGPFYDETIEEYVPRIGCDWLGRYTRGNVGVRGTRLWFLPIAVEKYNNYNSEKESIWKAKIMNLDEFPGDDFNLRADDLEYLIDRLEGKPLKSIYQEAYEFTNEYGEGLYFRKTDEYSKRSKVWLFKFRFIKPVILELKKVLALCEEHDVTFEWI